MSQTINVPLSGRGIERLIRETENWKNRFQERTAVFLDRVAQEGMERASVKFSQAVYDGTNDVSVTVEPVGTMSERSWRQVGLLCLSSSAQA